VALPAFARRTTLLQQLIDISCPPFGLLPWALAGRTDTAYYAGSAKTDP